MEVDGVKIDHFFNTMPPNEMIKYIQYKIDDTNGDVEKQTKIKEVFKRLIEKINEKREMGNNANKTEFKAHIINVDEEIMKNLKFDTIVKGPTEIIETLITDQLPEISEAAGKKDNEYYRGLYMKLHSDEMEKEIQPKSGGKTQKKKKKKRSQSRLKQRTIKNKV